MNEKEFEEIYRKTKEEETPDLWDRIETELDKETSHKKNTIKRIISVSTLVAAVIIFFIASPFFDMIKENQAGIGEKNAEEVQDLSNGTNDLSTKETDYSEYDVDEENVLQDFVRDKEEEAISSENMGNDALAESKEASGKDTNSNWDKVVNILKKEGIVLSEVNRDKIQKLEVIKAEKLPEEFQKVIEELKKIKEEQTYFIDLNNVYYVEIEEQIYKIN